MVDRIIEPETSELLTFIGDLNALVITLNKLPNKKETT